MRRNAFLLVIAALFALVLAGASSGRAPAADRVMAWSLEPSHGPHVHAWGPARGAASAGRKMIVPKRRHGWRHVLAPAVVSDASEDDDDDDCSGAPNAPRPSSWEDDGAVVDSAVIGLPPPARDASPEPPPPAGGPRREHRRRLSRPPTAAARA